MAYVLREEIIFVCLIEFSICEASSVMLTKSDMMSAQVDNYSSSKNPIPY